MSDRIISQGATSESIFVLIRDRTTGHGKTGLVAADVNFYYARPRVAPTAFAVTDLAAITDAFSAGGFKEYSAAVAPGLYRIDPPNAAFAMPAVTNVVIGWKGANVEDDKETINLVPFDPTVIDKTGMKLAADGMSLIVGYVP